MHRTILPPRLLAAAGLGVLLSGLTACDNSAQQSETAKGELIAELMQDLEDQRTRYEKVIQALESRASLRGGGGAMRREEVLGMLSTWLHELPEDAVVRLSRRESDGSPGSDLAIENLKSVSIREREIAAQAVMLSTVSRADAKLDIVMKVFAGPVAEDAQPLEELVLLRGVSRFEWWAMDGDTAEWVETWDDHTRLPAWFELNALFSAQDRELLHYFACPPRAEASTQG